MNRTAPALPFTIVNVTPGERYVKSIFDVEFADGALVVRGVKVIQGKNGLFLSMPASKVTGAWEDLVLVDRDLRARILDTATRVSTLGMSAPAGKIYPKAAAAGEASDAPY